MVSEIQQLKKPAERREANEIDLVNREGGEGVRKGPGSWVTYFL